MGSVGQGECIGKKQAFMVPERLTYNIDGEDIWRGGTSSPQKTVFIPIITQGKRIVGRAQQSQIQNEFGKSDVKSLLETILFPCWASKHMGQVFVFAESTQDLLTPEAACQMLLLPFPDDLPASASATLAIFLLSTPIPSPPHPSQSPSCFSNPGSEESRGDKWAERELLSYLLPKATALVGPVNESALCISLRAQS